MASSTGSRATDRIPARVWRLLKLLAVLALLVVVGVFVVRWGRDAIDSTEAETAQVQTEAAGLEVEVERFLRLEEIRTEFEAQFMAAQDALPQSPDLPGLVDQIVALAGDTDVQLLSLLPQPPAPVSSPGADPSLQREVSLAVKLAGTEDAVVGFVDGLRRLERVVVVDNVSMTWPGNELRAQHAAGADAAAGAEGEGEAVSPDADPAVEAPAPAAAVLDPEFEVIADLEARAFVWAPGATADRAAAESVAGSGDGEAPAEESVDGGG